MAPPTQPWTPLWMLSSRVLKLRYETAVNARFTVEDLGSWSGVSGSRSVIGSGPSVTAPGNACLTLARSAALMVIGPDANGLIVSARSRYPGGKPVVWEDGLLQSHHGSDTVAVWSPRAVRRASVNARSKKYRYARCQGRNSRFPC